jgi:uncharacterized membrane protein
MVKAPRKKKQGHILLRILPIQRFVISLIVAVVTYFLISSVDLQVMVKLMVAWSVFALSYIITSWIVFLSQNKTEVREHASQEDGSRLYVFSLIIITSFAGLFSVLLLMLSQNSKDTPQLVFIPVAIGAMLFSWLMVHTMFAFHYAYLFYSDDTNDSTKHAEGLNFPGREQPDYLDFAYFSFVVGMTFQVSDIDVTSKAIRRLVLLHGLLSFGLNTFVVALTINIIAGLLK